MTVKKWNFALIGCGSIAEFHLNAIRELDNTRLIMISDRKTERAREIGTRENCEWTNDYKELLSHPEVDIVCVTTSSGSHAIIGTEALKAGKHLIVEKPMAMTVSDAERMNRLAEDKGLIISVISQRRFESQHRIVREIVKAGKLGKLLLLEASCHFFRSQDYYDSAPWRGTLEHDGGAVMNQGIHSLDLMLWFGGPVRTVYGKIATRTHRMEAEDIGSALIEFHNGAYGTFVSSTSITPGFPPALHLFGEYGSIKIEGTSIVHWAVPGVPKPETENETSAGGGVSDPKSISNRYHRLQLSDMLAALSEGRQPDVTGIDGLNAIRVVETIYRSAAEGKEITL